MTAAATDALVETAAARFDAAVKLKRDAAEAADTSEGEERIDEEDRAWVEVQNALRRAAPTHTR